MSIRYFFIVVFLLSSTWMRSAFTDKPSNPPQENALTEKKKTQEPDISLEKAAGYFSHIAKQIHNDYVEEKTNRKLLEGALSGMLSTLDPHSVYLTPEKFEELKSQTEGKFGGLGIEITMEDGVVKVIAPMDDTPASKEGVQAGDLIVAIDGKPVFGLTIYEAVKLLKGDPGSKVKITIRRQKEMFDLTLERDIIKIKPVKYKIEGNMGYLRISTFNDKTTEELVKAVKAIQKSLGNKLIGYVVDLRNNPGGLLDQAVSVANVFLKSGTIVSIKDREKNIVDEYKAKGADLTKGLPIVVLINSGSASASEIVAGALQDHHRALILGTQSFGKGSVQKIIPQKDIGAIKMTIALFYTPHGKTIQKRGISPDIKIEQQVDLKTINSDKRLREAYLEDALESEKDSREEELKEALKKDPSVFKEKDFKDLPDYQLDQAFKILQAISLDHQLLLKDRL